MTNKLGTFEILPAILIFIISVDCSEQSSSSRKSPCSPLGCQNDVTSSSSKNEKSQTIQTEGLLPTLSPQQSQPIAFTRSNDSQLPDNHLLSKKPSPKKAKSVPRWGVTFGDTTLITRPTVGHWTNKEGRPARSKRYFDNPYKTGIPRKRQQENGSESRLGDRAKFDGYHNRHQQAMVDPRLRGRAAHQDHRIKDNNNNTMSGMTMRLQLPAGSCYQLYCTGVCTNAACHFSHEVEKDHTNMVFLQWFSCAALLVC